MDILGGTLAPPEFRVSEKRTEREIDSLLLPTPPDLRVEVKFPKNF